MRPNLPVSLEFPGRLSEHVEPYLDSLNQRNFSNETIKGRRREIRVFIGYCSERSVTEPSQITVSLIERFRKNCTEKVSLRTGRRLSVVTRIHLLSTIRDFCRYLVKKGEMLFNPALEVELPRMEHRLPRNVLTASETESILAMIDIFTPTGLRNRAILEVLYSTGVRRSEACNIDIQDINFSSGTIFIRQGKGAIDRVVPAGERSLFWVEKYISDGRPSLARSTTGEALFVSQEGHRLSKDMVTTIVTTYRKMAGVTKKGSAHMLRHTAATLMLENGADVRYVQALLGHRELSSTQRYTHVAIRKLKEVHEKTHPAKFRKSSIQKQAILREPDSDEAEEMRRDLTGEMDSGT